MRRDPPREPRQTIGRALALNQRVAASQVVAASDAAVATEAVEILGEAVPANLAAKLDQINSRLDQLEVDP